MNSAIRPKHKSHIGSTVRICTSAGEFTSPSNIVNLFNDHFSTLFSSLSPANYSNFDFTESCSFCFAPIMVDEVLNILLSLNTDKATGPVGIPARILKVFAPVIADSLTAFLMLVWRMLLFPLIGKKPMIFQCTNLVILVFSLIIDQSQFFLVLPKYLSPLFISRFSLTFY